MSLRYNIKAKAILVIATFAVAFPSIGNSSPYVEAQIDAAVAPCLSNSSILSETNKTILLQNAVALLDPCYNSLIALDKFEKANLNITPSERNYMFFKGGYVIWITAAAEVIRNNSNVNAQICNQVKIADTLWSNVSVPSGHRVEQEINNYALRPMLVPICNEAFPPQN